ncbi:MAG: Asp-tRNA(Asn)/Glu-tRNA(Gln) amidotransferase subunit GatB [Peptococcaceae bacterium]|jgi:aspartyl-tRNA(Asn)/glutamyl-tRNA(Gln) amidotransferase subunit B|nr:Asp-tRNA(Asn)/Glu-tRNA(Gln) amidotransferase subunit GatB [Peptococcaceae bacterium]
MSDYKAVIGLEVHAVLATDSKIYCGCSTDFGGEENTHICPGCMGMPGTLPLLNRKVVDYCMKAGLALNCRINPFSQQDRKHYYYPDLPKGFQLSQLEFPVCQDGWLDIESEGQTKRIGINRIHIEEDAGKLIHGVAETQVDLNRGAAGLIEIVSEPHMSSPEDVYAYMEALREILLYTGVCNCKMEEGSLRCDVNISIHKEGEPFGVRTEMKNLNSLSAAKAAAAYEIKRQEKVLEEGGKLFQATLRWDDEKGVNSVMRVKEFADEYYYFPEPDIAPIIISAEEVEAVRAALPELPKSRRQRYREKYGLSAYDAGILTVSKALSDMFDQAAAAGAPAKPCANLIMGDIARLLNEKGMEAEEVPFDGVALAELANLVSQGAISSSAGSKVMESMFEPGNAGKSPKAIMEEQNLGQVSDVSALDDMCRDVLERNPKIVADYKGGRTQAISALVGQVMKASGGKANPGMVNQLLQELLK